LIPIRVSYTLGNCPIISIQQIELSVTWNADGHSAKYSKTLAIRTLSADELNDFQKTCQLYIKQGGYSPVFDGKLMKVQHDIIMKVNTSSFHKKNPMLSTSICLPQVLEKEDFAV
jgi:hypothetical protein